MAQSAVPALSVLVIHCSLHPPCCWLPCGQELSYSATSGDEVEDLLLLLAYIKVGHVCTQMTTWCQDSQREEALYWQAHCRQWVMALQSVLRPNKRQHKKGAKLELKSI